MRICKLRSIGTTKVQCLGPQCIQYDINSKTCMMNQFEKEVEKKQKKLTKLWNKQKI